MRRSTPLVSIKNAGAAKVDGVGRVVGSFQDWGTTSRSTSRSNGGEQLQRQKLSTDCAEVGLKQFLGSKSSASEIFC